MILLKIGVQKEEGSSTVWFMHRMLTTALKNKWENCTSGRVFHKVGPNSWTLWITLAIGCKLCFMYICSPISSKYKKSENYYPSLKDCFSSYESLHFQNTWESLQLL